jgi:galactose mutarotase-like enzyme
MITIETDTVRGWERVLLRTDDIEVVVLPGKGGDVTSLRHRRTGTDLLWTTRWGVRSRGAMTTHGSSEAALYEAYPGGWQTAFPNTGDACVEHGVEWPMHGEVWTAPFDWTATETGVRMTADLVRSPFRFLKTVDVVGDAVRVTETATNTANEPVEVTWSQHPAFGAPLVDPAARVTTSATTVRGDILDPAYAGAAQTTRWPTFAGPGGSAIDLSTVPAPRAGETRMAFLGDFTEPAAAWVQIANDRLGLAARIEWDATEFPYAWYWLEAGGRAGFPWYSDAYVLAIEPASSWPGRGIAAIRSSTGTQRLIAPGESMTHCVQVRVVEL